MKRTFEWMMGFFVVGFLFLSNLGAQFTTVKPTLSPTSPTLQKVPILPEINLPPDVVDYKIDGLMVHLKFNVPIDITSISNDYAITFEYEDGDDTKQGRISGGNNCSVSTGTDFCFCPEKDESSIMSCNDSEVPSSGRIFINKKLKSMAGVRLQEQYSNSYEKPVVDVVKFRSCYEKIHLTFNRPMDGTSVKNSIKFYNGSGANITRPANEISSGNIETKDDEGKELALAPCAFIKSEDIQICYSGDNVGKMVLNIGAKSKDGIHLLEKYEHAITYTFGGPCSQ